LTAETGLGTVRIVGQCSLWKEKKMILIDRDALPKGRVEWEDIAEAPTVDAVPIEWINQRVKGLKIQLINADEDDVDLIWHLRDEIQTLTELIDYWKEEQEKQNESTV
jgi:hypothetical protein